MLYEIGFFVMCLMLPVTSIICLKVGINIAKDRPISHGMVKTSNKKSDEEKLKEQEERVVMEFKPLGVKHG